MMNKTLGLLAVAALVAACSPSPQKSEQAVLMQVGGSPVSAKEFLYFYNKNNYNDTVPVRKAVTDYLELFTKFKLKVKEAEELGLQNTTAFINEFKTYRSQLAKPYMSESQVTKDLLNEAYDRMKTEVRASHILIRVDENTSPQDTAKAYQRVMAIRKKIVDGADFGQVAADSSEDPSAKMNRGDLGYFTSLKMVYPFESVAYTTPVGNVSQPVRTQFGYHLIKTLDKRPSQAKCRWPHHGAGL
ncbi:MAG: hypothetical protein HC842_00765 [Cytophagales bacterium]|nr:hypothetical protein [Cytophagales bacterium]